MSLSNVFSSVAIANDGVDNVNFIKSQLDGTSTWYETFGWFGALETLDNKQMYQVLMNNPATLTFTGTPVSPSDNPLFLASNWNWIGFLPQSPTPIATAFGSIAIANDGIDNVNFIKSQLDGTSTWYETFGWFGALEDLQYSNGDGTYHEKKAWYSNMGNAVDFYTIGDGSIGASGGEGSGYSRNDSSYRLDSNYNIVSSGGTLSLTSYDRRFGGTSSACPVGAGLIATKLQHNRNWAWSDIKHWLATRVTNQSSGTDFFRGCLLYTSPSPRDS